MAPKGKKASTKKKPTKGKTVQHVQTRKRSARSLTGASNPCCPVIKMNCKTEKKTLPKSQWKKEWTGGSEGSGDYVPVKTWDYVEKCTVMGRGQLSREEANKKVLELAEAQKARRCVPIEEKKYG